MITCSLGLFIKEYTLPTCSEMMYATSSNLRTSSHHTEQVIQETLWFPTFCSIFHPKKNMPSPTPPESENQKEKDDAWGEVLHKESRAVCCTTWLWVLQLLILQYFFAQEMHYWHHTPSSNETGRTEGPFMMYYTYDLTSYII